MDRASTRASLDTLTPPDGQRGEPLHIRKRAVWTKERTRFIRHRSVGTHKELP